MTNPEALSSRTLRTLTISAVLALLFSTPHPLHAHNAVVHRDMTDRAYEIMLALAGGQLEAAADPGLTELATASRTAIRRFGALPAGLPRPKDSRCIDPDTIKKIGTNTPNWNAPADFKQMLLATVPFAVSLTYITGSDCGVDETWKPGAFFDTVNGGPQAPGGVDHTGAVLGFWAHQPDDEEDDWHVFVRPTNLGGLSTVKSYIEGALGVAGGTVWVTVRCALSCAASAVTGGLVGDCKNCIDHAIQEAKDAVHEGVTTIDGLVPGFGDHTSLDMYTGMGHHLNVAGASGAEPWKLNGTSYDDRPGLLIENAGPTGSPDTLEIVATVVADELGLTVHYDPSRGPKLYEIAGVNDFHPDSKHRDEEDWEWLSFPHTPFTPLDNLAFHGWKEFRDAPKANVPSLGWPLHAFGDAIVPMHVAGTFGWGHRPYEDAFANHLDSLLNVDDREAARTQARAIAMRAVAWRRIILDWRTRHPERGNDIPVRDLITQLAERTWRKVDGPARFVWPFNPAMSSAYAIPGPTREAAILYYEKTGSDAVNGDLLEEGIAAELAFLVSAAEVVP